MPSKPSNAIPHKCVGVPIKDLGNPIAIEYIKGEMVCSIFHAGPERIKNSHTLLIRVLLQVSIFSSAVNLVVKFNHNFPL